MAKWWRGGKGPRGLPRLTLTAHIDDVTLKMTAYLSSVGQVKKKKGKNRLKRDHSLLSFSSSSSSLPPISTLFCFVYAHTHPSTTQQHTNQQRKKKKDLARRHTHNHHGLDCIKDGHLAQQHRPNHRPGRPVWIQLRGHPLPRRHESCQRRYIILHLMTFVLI